MVTEASNSERDETVESFLEALSAPLEDEPESQVLRMDLIRLVQSTLDCLPSHYGDVLEWKYVDGLPLNEIAMRLELGPKAAESLLGRARGRISRGDGTGRRVARKLAGVVRWATWLTIQIPIQSRP